MQLIQVLSTSIQDLLPKIVGANSRISSFYIFARLIKKSIIFRKKENVILLHLKMGLFIKPFKYVMN